MLALAILIVHKIGQLVLCNGEEIRDITKGDGRNLPHDTDMRTMRRSNSNSGTNSTPPGRTQVGHLVSSNEMAEQDTNWKASESWSELRYVVPVPLPTISHFLLVCVPHFAVSVCCVRVCVCVVARHKPKTVNIRLISANFYPKSVSNFGFSARPAGPL
jgi:hypothetical protein